MKNQEQFSVSISDSIVIGNISDVRDLILSAFDQKGPITIDISRVTEADITLPQLIESARRSAAIEGREIRLSQPAEGAVLQLLQRGGFLDTSDPARVDFWLQGMTPQ